MQQDVLVEPQDPQSRPEQELLAIPKEKVPNSARHVQREGLGVERQDPGGGFRCFYSLKSFKLAENPLNYH